MGLAASVLITAAGCGKATDTGSAAAEAGSAAMNAHATRNAFLIAFISLAPYFLTAGFFSPFAVFQKFVPCG